jgi:type IV pilus assembly protein PilV
MRSPRSAGPRRQTAFALAEVLVSILIVAVGLLGVAKIQAYSISTARYSKARAAIALQASSLADAMRVDTLYWAAGLAPATTTLPTMQTGQTADCTLGACTATQLAQYDLAQWAQGLLAQVPSTTAAQVTCSTAGAAPVTCTIEVDWTETVVSTSAATTAGPATTPFKYTLVVQP